MIYIYERLIESFTQKFHSKTLIYSLAKTSDCLYERVIESLTQQICSKKHIHFETKYYSWGVVWKCTEVDSALALFGTIISKKLTGNIVSQMLNINITIYLYVSMMSLFVTDYHSYGANRYEYKNKCKNKFYLNYILLSFN